MSTVNKFKSSHTAARLLKTETNKSVIIPIVVRWSSLALTYKRVSEVWEEMNKICKDENWPQIQQEDLEMIRKVLALIEPFKEATNKLQADKIPTLSWLYPAIKGLVQMLEVNIY